MKYLILLGVLLSSTAHANWYGSYEIDDMTDAKRGLVAFVENGNLVESDDVLLVACNEEEPIGFSVFIRYSLIAPISEGLVTTFRFDKNEPVSIKSSRSNNIVYFGIEAKLPIDIPDSYLLEAPTFILKMIKSNSLVVHLSIGDKLIKNNYNLIGFKKAFEDACSWHPKYEMLINF